MYSPAVALNELRTDHFQFPIIRPLYKNVRSDGLDQTEWGGIGENRHEVHILQAGENQTASFDRVQRSRWTFESAHTGIAVQAHYQAIGMTSSFC